MSVLDLDVPFCFGFVLALVFDLLGIIIVIVMASWQTILVVIPVIMIIQYLQVCNDPYNKLEVWKSIDLL